LSLCLNVMLSCVGRDLCGGLSLVQKSPTVRLNKITKPQYVRRRRSLQGLQSHRWLWYPCFACKKYTGTSISIASTAPLALFSQRREWQNFQ
jgi:hypothetical protein